MWQPFLLSIVSVNSQENAMKKKFLLLSLVVCSRVIAKPLPDEAFLAQVDLITRTRNVQKQGAATIGDIRVAVNIASGDYEEEADKTWWEQNPTCGCIISFATGVGVTAYYFLNYR